MTNQEIAAVFEQVADLLEYQSANPFRVRAYRNGAKKIGELAEPLAAIHGDAARRLTELEGIGKDLAEKIATLLATGTLPMLVELQAQIPAGVLTLSRVPGVGPKKAAALHKELGISSLAELRAACEEQRVRGLKGFGAKTEETILKGLAVAEEAGVRMRWADAERVVDALLEHMRGEPAIKQLEIAGSFRRGRETIGDLDLLVDATDVPAAMDRFGAFPQVQETLARGDTKMTVRLASGLQVDLRVVPAESFGAALQYFTGSKDHNVIVRGRAKQQGLKVSDWGVFRIEAAEGESKETYIAGRTEEEVYAAVGLPWFPPEMREAREEFNWAAAGALPTLVTLEDIRGDLHMHTTASDGQDSIEAMVAAARARGLSYVAITDHSKRVSMARGLDGDRLRRQWREVDQVNRQSDDVEVLKGIECDILEKGGMDLPDDVLAEADWVIASVHYGQNQSRQQITERILEALENPHVDMLAHPTGRLINRREPYDVDLDRVMAAAVKHRKLLELNANPARLDLNDVYCAAAKRLGIPIVINTDAHHTDGMDVMRFGVLQARRGGLTAANVANTRPFAEFRQLIGGE
ncbi:DNA polymerase/3'-5' exonuclease PolX [Lacipirellula limnantheis]|uniref:DNA polymerase beta n=1 Tax=Lacipirellula limnantheis TaxID=2528024 RepID=A0A517TXK6_9BACT|nr:DNA polymerase/3'-5' exonuclease PolX [Lacipirellula limnantheis]QDT73093.1 DNA polymerase/3'-5' exonuclease PolX [Lacipirellula limnantheis]